VPRFDSFAREIDGKAISRAAHESMKIVALQGFARGRRRPIGCETRDK
jgi:hypothetical protein